MHCPVRTRNPAPDACPASSLISRVLPTPASPPISRKAGSPARARSISAVPRAISAWRPMNTGLTTLGLMPETVSQIRLRRQPAGGGQAERGWLWAGCPHGGGGRTLAWQPSGACVSAACCQHSWAASAVAVSA
jgi:hypothetical protein